MRKNTPVTNVEQKVKDEQVLISKTDLKGIITYASHDFVTLAGFSEEELIGNPHNMVRHPDTPPWIFEDMWREIKAGRPWTGVVKNRCKSGDYYWVYAEVSPIHKEGKIIGYMSNRYRTTDEQRTLGEELYKRDSAPEKKGRLLGNSTMTVRRKLLWMVGTGTIFLAAISGFLFYSFKKVNADSMLGMDIVDKARSLENGLQKEFNIWNLSMSQKLSPSEIDERLQLIQGVDKEEADNMESLDHMMEEYGAQHDKLDELLEKIKGNQSALIKAMNESLRLVKDGQVFDGYDRVIEPAKNLDGQLKELNQEVRVVLDTEFARKERNHLLIIMMTVLAWLIFLIVFPMYLSRVFLKPVAFLEKLTRLMAEGDLTGRIERTGNDEMGRLLGAMKIMRINIRGLTSQILDSSRVSASSSEQLAEHTSLLTDAAKEQVASTEETSAAVEELTSAAEHIVEIIKKQTENVQANRTNSKAMVDSMKNMESSMIDLKNLAKESSERASSGESTINQAVSAMQEIRNQANRIGEIINLITEISEQTNLLSLNAAIEAARAGEGGRGFAVVADEISRLADRTGESVKEIEKLIKLTTAAVENGSLQFSNAAQNFTDIIHRVNSIDESTSGLMSSVKMQVEKANTIGMTTNKVTDIASEIENAAQEQKRAMVEMNENIQSINGRSQSVGASAEELTVLVKEMSTQADYLENLVRQFKVK